MKLTLAAALAVLSLTQPALAGFQITDAPPPMMPQPTYPADAVNLPRPVKVAPRAQGFGVDVPLAVAAEQIVPRGIKVELGEGVNPDATVVWKGGRPYPAVLRDAIRPLGYQMKQSPTVVRIVRAGG